MLQRTCKKVSIDFLNHAIPNDEHWCFRFLGVSWVLRWWWWFISFFIRGSIFLIYYMAHLIYIWGCNSCVGQVRCFIWICLNNTLFLCFDNFVNWRSLSDWMGFEVVDIQVSRRSSFISKMFSSFGLSHGLLPLHSQEFRLSSALMTLFFSFTSYLKKSILLLSEEIWLWRLQRSSSRSFLFR